MHKTLIHKIPSITRFGVLPLLLPCAFLCAQLQAETTTETSIEETFQNIVDEHWSTTLSENPTFATSLGVRDYDTLLSGPSLKAYEASVSKSAALLKRLKSIPRNSLSEANRLNHSLLQLDLENEIEAAKHGGRYMIMTNRGGPHLSLTSMVGRLPFFTDADYQSYTARLQAIPAYLEGATARLQRGLDAGWVQPCEPMRGYEKSIATHLVDRTEDSVFMQPFMQKPAVINDKKFARTKQEAASLVSERVIPAFAKFHELYMQNYAPNGNTKVGTNSLPGGDDYYQHRVKFFTTTDLTADDVHNIGLSEVARIRNEMDEVIKAANFEGDFKAWLEYLKTNPEFYPKTAEERMQVAATISKKMDGELPKLFGKLPRMPYGLKEIPLNIAEKTTTAYYQRPAGDGSRAGFYQTPYTNFGRLSYEMWRACRLVVDTGLHSKGWTRQQAIDYMAENSGLSMNNVVSEVDRYITWPGQALAYKIGELNIRELRAKAEKELGDSFDLREFHDKVLENGALPLSELERIVTRWVAERS